MRRRSRRPDRGSNCPIAATGRRRRRCRGWRCWRLSCVERPRGPCSLRHEDTLSPMETAEYATRIAFVVELAEHLHAYGTTAQRLEGALIAVAGELGLELEPFANPTGMILSFSDPGRPPGVSDTTRVIRMPPGDTDLAKMCERSEDVRGGKEGSRTGRD